METYQIIILVCVGIILVNLVFSILTQQTTENFVLHNDSLYELHFKKIIEDRR